MEEDASPPPGCYLLVVLGKPLCDNHKEKILQRVAKGLLSWDTQATQCDLHHLEQVCEKINPSTVIATESGILLQHSIDKLAVEVLLNPQLFTLKQCMRNLLLSPTGHKLIVYAGYSFRGSGSWILRDGTYGLREFSDEFSDPKVCENLSFYSPKSLRMHLHCDILGEWSDLKPSQGGHSLPSAIDLLINPPDSVSGVSGVASLIEFLERCLHHSVAQSDDLELSPLVGSIRFEKPTIYLFPAGQGDCSLFGVNGFTMLIDGGYGRYPCFWKFIRHIERLDSMLITRMNENNCWGLLSTLQGKQAKSIFRRVGHIFANLGQESEEEKDVPSQADVYEDLTVGIVQLGQLIKHDILAQNRPLHQCCRESPPSSITLYQKIGHGKLLLYAISPSKDSRLLMDFLANWSSKKDNFSMVKIRSSSKKSLAQEIAVPICDVMSICCLLVWIPADPKEKLTRILLPGSAPQSQIFEGLAILAPKLDFLNYRICTSSSLTVSKEGAKKVATKVLTAPVKSMPSGEAKKLARFRSASPNLRKPKAVKKGQDHEKKTSSESLLSPVRCNQHEIESRQNLSKSSKVISKTLKESANRTEKPVSTASRLNRPKTASNLISKTKKVQNEARDKVESRQKSATIRGGQISKTKIESSAVSAMENKVKSSNRNVTDYEPDEEILSVTLSSQYRDNVDVTIAKASEQSDLGNHGRRQSREGDSIEASPFRHPFSDHFRDEVEPDSLEVYDLDGHVDISKDSLEHSEDEATAESVSLSKIDSAEIKAKNISQYLETTLDAIETEKDKTESETQSTVGSEESEVTLIGSKEDEKGQTMENLAQLAGQETGEITVMSDSQKFPLKTAPESPNHLKQSEITVEPESSSLKKDQNESKPEESIRKNVFPQSSEAKTSDIELPKNASEHKPSFSASKSLSIDIKSQLLTEKCSKDESNANLEANNKILEPEEIKKESKPESKVSVEEENLTQAMDEIFDSSHKEEKSSEFGSKGLGLVQKEKIIEKSFHENYLNGSWKNSADSKNVLENFAEESLDPRRLESNRKELLQLSEAKNENVVEKSVIETFQKTTNPKVDAEEDSSNTNAGISTSRAPKMPEIVKNCKDSEKDQGTDSKSVQIHSDDEKFMDSFMPSHESKKIMDSVASEKSGSIDSRSNVSKTEKVDQVMKLEEKNVHSSDMKNQIDDCFIERSAEISDIPIEKDSKLTDVNLSNSPESQAAETHNANLDSDHNKTRESYKISKEASRESKNKTETEERITETAQNKSSSSSVEPNISEPDSIQVENLDAKRSDICLDKEKPLSLKEKEVTKTSDEHGNKPSNVDSETLSLVKEHEIQNPSSKIEVQKSDEKSSFTQPDESPKKQLEIESSFTKIHDSDGSHLLEKFESNEQTQNTSSMQTLLDSTENITKPSAIFESSNSLLDTSDAQDSDAAEKREHKAQQVVKFNPVSDAKNLITPNGKVIHEQTGKAEIEDSQKDSSPKLRVESKSEEVEDAAINKQTEKQIFSQESSQKSSLTLGKSLNEEMEIVNLVKPINITGKNEEKICQDSSIANCGKCFSEESEKAVSNAESDVRSNRKSSKPELSESLSSKSPQSESQNYGKTAEMVSKGAEVVIKDSHEEMLLEDSLFTLESHFSASQQKENAGKVSLDSSGTLSNFSVPKIASESLPEKLVPKSSSEEKTNVDRVDSSSLLTEFVTSDQPVRSEVKSDPKLVEKHTKEKEMTSSKDEVIQGDLVLRSLVTSEACKAKKYEPDSKFANDGSASSPVYKVEIKTISESDSIISEKLFKTESAKDSEKRREDDKSVRQNTTEITCSKTTLQKIDKADENLDGIESDSYLSSESLKTQVHQVKTNESTSNNVAEYKIEQKRKDSENYMESSKPQTESMIEDTLVSKEAFHEELANSQLSKITSETTCESNELIQGEMPSFEHPEKESALETDFRSDELVGKTASFDDQLRNSVVSTKDNSEQENTTETSLSTNENLGLQKTADPNRVLNSASFQCTDSTWTSSISKMSEMKIDPAESDVGSQKSSDINVETAALKVESMRPSDIEAPVAAEIRKTTSSVTSTTRSSESKDETSSMPSYDLTFQAVETPDDEEGKLRDLRAACSSDPSGKLISFGLNESRLHSQAETLEKVQKNLSIGEKSVSSPEILVLDSERNEHLKSKSMGILKEEEAGSPSHFITEMQTTEVEMSQRAVLDSSEESISASTTNVGSTRSSDEFESFTHQLGDAQPPPSLSRSLPGSEITLAVNRPDPKDRTSLQKKSSDILRTKSLEAESFSKFTGSVAPIGLLGQVAHLAPEPPSMQVRRTSQISGQVLYEEESEDEMNNAALQPKGRRLLESEPVFEQTLMKQYPEELHISAETPSTSSELNSPKDSSRLVSSTSSSFADKSASEFSQASKVSLCCFPRSESLDKVEKSVKKSEKTDQEKLTASISVTLTTETTSTSPARKISTETIKVDPNLTEEQKREKDEILKEWGKPLGLPMAPEPEPNKKSGSKGLVSRSKSTSRSEEGYLPPLSFQRNSESSISVAEVQDSTMANVHYDEPRSLDSLGKTFSSPQIGPMTFQAVETPENDVFDLSSIHTANLSDSKGKFGSFGTKSRLQTQAETLEKVQRTLSIGEKSVSIPEILVLDSTKSEHSKSKSMGILKEEEIIPCQLVTESVTSEAEMVKRNMLNFSDESLEASEATLGSSQTSQEFVVPFVATNTPHPKLPLSHSVIGCEEFLAFSRVEQNRRDSKKSVTFGERSASVEEAEEVVESSEGSKVDSLQTHKVHNLDSSQVAGSLEFGLEEMITSNTNLTEEQEKKKQQVLKEWGKPLGLPIAAEPEAVKKTDLKARPSRSKSSTRSGARLASSSATNPLVKPIHTELAYIPNHGDRHYANGQFFALIRARYYVLSSVNPSVEILDALIEGKKLWENKDAEVTLIPTHESEPLCLWMSNNQQVLSELKIDVAPSASRCTVILQEQESSCAAYRVEF